jgi:hypothetical protein
MTTYNAQQPHHDSWSLRVLHWTPRILALLFVAFLAIFALDVFGAGYSPLETIVALFMHLLPNFILLALVLLAWRWPWVGTLAFCGWAIFYVISFPGFDPVTFILIAGIPFLVGLLFGTDWLVRRRMHG